MRSVQITRAGDLSISAQLDEMHRWLEEEGTRPTDLRAVRVFNGRVIFVATFERTIDADRFLQEFGEMNTAA
jgi:hypoxanthine-guanine phosphoribosyltransferase